MIKKSCFVISQLLQHYRQQPKGSKLMMVIFVLMESYEQSLTQLHTNSVTQLSNIYSQVNHLFLSRSNSQPYQNFSEQATQNTTILKQENKTILKVSEKRRRRRWNMPFLSQNKTPEKPNLFLSDALACRRTISGSCCPCCSNSVYCSFISLPILTARKLTFQGSVRGKASQNIFLL